MHVGHDEPGALICTMSNLCGHTVRTFEQTEPFVVLESAGESSNTVRDVETEPNSIQAVPTSVGPRLLQVTFASVWDRIFKISQPGSESLDLIDEVDFHVFIHVSDKKRLSSNSFNFLKVSS